MTGSTYNPSRWSDIETTKVAPNVIGFTGTATANTTTDIDQKIDDDSFIRSIELVVRNQAAGDKLTIKIVDVDNILGSGAGTVISTPVKDFNIHTDAELQAKYESVAPFKILGGLYVRFAYTSTSMSTAVTVSPNLMFLKALV